MLPANHFRPRHRIAHARDYQAVFAQRIAKSRGPLTVFLRPSDRPEHRLGLSIGRRVGNAVIRGRLKRQIREAFRLDRSVYPIPIASSSYDIVVSARKHNPLPHNEYRTHLKAAIEAAHREHQRRHNADKGPNP